MDNLQVSAVGGEVRISADSHVTEPLDLWEKELPARLRDQALRFPEREYGKGDYVRFGGYDAAACLDDMAADGISAEVLFPTLGTAIYRQFYDRPFDLELAKACERVYNDWLIGFCSASPERLWGQALIGLWDIDYAVREMERAKNEGLKGVAIWIAPPEGLSFTTNHYERFWSAAEELQLPIGLHINVGFGAYMSRAAETRYDALARRAFGHKVVAMKAITEMILSGVFERHPDLRILLAEFESGWIPFFLGDLDVKLLDRDLRAQARLSLLPSEYFSRSVCSTFMQDSVTGFMLQRWGIDNFVFSNDYPHPGGIWPYSDDVISLTLDGLPSNTRRKVLGETVAKLFGQPVPAPLPRKALTGLDHEEWSRPWLKKAGDFTFNKPQMGLAV
jgi:predicted TIM-barrel fold metal-dependent hydrolase